MLVSVVVPMYNCEKYIERCVKSILKQTHSKLEVILVNDGSCDQTLSIAEVLSKNDGRIILLTQENQGVSAARNNGLSIARGEYVAFVDADDYIEPDMIESLLSIADTDTMAVCDILYNDSDIRAYKCKQDSIIIDDSFPERFLSGDYGQDIFLGVCNKLFNLELIKQNAIQFPPIKVGEDMLFIIKYCQYIARIRILHKRLYHYCIYRNSAVNSISKDYLESQIQTINECRNPRYMLTRKTLDSMSLDRILSILGSGYAISQSQEQFKVYYKAIKNTVLFRDALKGSAWSRYVPLKSNVKRIILRAALRLSWAKLIYHLMHGYRKFNYKQQLQYYGNT
ncbi:MAG: glycosyltransferase [Candidatus Pelethousia sp.]|nr:glycosyltransferase [Candidatus Pelethousia sp.]